MTVPAPSAVWRQRTLRARELHARGRFRQSHARACALVLASLVMASAQALADGAWWNGFAAHGFDGSVFALTVYRGELIAGGEFNSAGGTEAHCIARWNGASWSPLGAGLGHTDSLETNVPYVSGLTVYHDELIAVGRFTSAGGWPVTHIARWDGSSWNPLPGEFNGLIYAVTSFQDELIVGGRWSRIDGVGPAFIARLLGGSWVRLGSGVNGAVSAFAPYGDRLAVGGYFTRVESIPSMAVGIWTGAYWEPAASGVTGGDPLTWVFALASYQGQLVAGGSFTQASGVSMSGIASFDGQTWHPLGQGIRGDASTYVFALTEYQGELVAAGNFLRADRQMVHYVASWNGERWAPMGVGLDNWSRALVSLDSHLYVGGDFGLAGGQTSGAVARWDGLTVPALFASFSAARVASGARVRWELAEGVASAPFHLHRRALGEGTDALVRLSATPLIAAPSGEYLDPAPPPGGAAYYLEQLGATGSVWHGPALLPADPDAGRVVSSASVLLPGTPNPFDLQTSVRFHVPTAGHAVLTVHDPRGREVVRLLDARVESGLHELLWDGRDASGRAAAQGLYLARLRYGGRELTQKLVRVSPR